jgi:hypothetical protein
MMVSLYCEKSELSEKGVMVQVEGAGCRFDLAESKIAQIFSRCIFL